MPDDRPVAPDAEEFDTEDLVHEDHEPDHGPIVSDAVVAAEWARRDLPTESEEA